MREPIKDKLKALRLHGMARALDAELDRAEREGMAPASVIERLLMEEASWQRERSLLNRLKRAQLPWPWTLDSFPFERQPGVNKSQIMSLRGMDFIKRHDNLLLIGGTGVGKSGLAIGLLREACLNGYSGGFYNAQMLLDELYTSLADHSTSRLIKKLSRVNPLVLDELSYMTLKPEQSNAFFRLMDQRYSRVSTIITTNLEPDEWYTLFQDRNLLSALLDRVRHHCITLHIEGPSLRSPEDEQNKAASAASGKA